MNIIRIQNSMFIKTYTLSVEYLRMTPTLSQNQHILVCVSVENRLEKKKLGKSLDLNFHAQNA